LGPLTRLRRQGRLAPLAVAVMSVCFGALGLVRAVWPVLVLFAAAGAAGVAFGVVRRTLLQVLTPDRLRGRVNSVGFVVGAGGPSLGDVEAGALAALTSPAMSAFTGGVAPLVGVGALGLALPAGGTTTLSVSPPRRPLPPVRGDGPARNCEATTGPWVSARLSACGDDGRVRLPVFVQGWQVECCGATFSVGDEVTWGLAFTEADGGP